MKRSEYFGYRFGLLIARISTDMEPRLLCSHMKRSTGRGDAVLSQRADRNASVVPDR